MQKRVLAIHDISCVGKCSLTVALPIISAAGIECSVLPTAVLSTHTGGFTGYTFRDLTADIDGIIAHWKTLDLKIDAVYTGYLGSFEQLALVERIIDELCDGDTLVLVDPVMADNGVLYGGFSADFPAGMANLCKKASVIVPNLTEASLMLGCEYIGSGYSREYIEDMLRALSALGPKRVVLTGVSFEKGKLGAACFDAETGDISYTFCDEVAGYYHGTGDVFGSALVSAVLCGKAIDEAAAAAVKFTVGSIERTAKAGTDVRYGVDFESGLADFARSLK